MVGAKLSKSLIQFSVDGQGCVPSLLLDLRPNYGGGNEGNGDLLQKSQAALSAPDPAACHHPPMLSNWEMCVQQLKVKRSSFQEQFLSPQS